MTWFRQSLVAGSAQLRHRLPGRAMCQPANFSRGRCGDAPQKPRVSEKFKRGAVQSSRLQQTGADQGRMMSARHVRRMGNPPCRRDMQKHAASDSSSRSKASTWTWALLQDRRSRLPERRPPAPSHLLENPDSPRFALSELSVDLASP